MNLLNTYFKKQGLKGLISELTEHLFYKAFDFALSESRNDCVIFQD